MFEPDAEAMPPGEREQLQLARLALQLLNKFDETNLISPPAFYSPLGETARADRPPNRGSVPLVDFRQPSIFARR